MNSKMLVSKLNELAELMEAEEAEKKEESIKKAKKNVVSLSEDKEKNIIESKDEEICNELLKLADELDELSEDDNEDECYRNSLTEEKTASAKTFKCPECGSKVLDTTKYCVKCKKKVASAKTFKCPECGTKVLDKTKYCVKCKKKVASENNDELMIKIASDLVDLAQELNESGIFD